MDDKKFNLEKRLIDFAVVIVFFFESMPKTSINTASKEK